MTKFDFTTLKMKKIACLGILIPSVLWLGLHIIRKSSVQTKPVKTIQSKVKKKVKTEKVRQLEFTKKQLEFYYASYKSPYVIHLRKALNGYLDGSNYGMDTPEIVISGKRTDETIDGLSSFDKSYYRSRFIVCIIRDFIGGGKEISIIFQDKPDKLFKAWVYKIHGRDKYDLRMFGQNLYFDKEKMVKIRQQYKKQLEDKKHAI